MRAAVTGGTGFVGAALINQLREKKWQISALARDPARLTAADGLRVITGDLDDSASLEDLALHADVFFHLAGVTHARADEDYRRVNVDGAAHAAIAAAGAGARFVHISSISARRPEVSAYARSKFDSEAAIAAASSNNPWIALRLPAIYGPGDFVTLPYFKLIKSGFALEPRTAEPARASILYVGDAARAIIAAGGNVPSGKVYEVGDECAGGHKWQDIGETLGRVLGSKPRRIRVPRSLIASYHGFLGGFERMTKRPPSIRAGQINEFFHPDWSARDQLLSEACGWRPETPLMEGFAKTARWYQDKGLL